MPLPIRPCRTISDAERDAYRRDGAVILRGVLQQEWIDHMRCAIDRVLATPAAGGFEYTESGSAGRYYGDFFLWTHDADFRAIALDSPLPALAAQMMQASEVTFFYDQLLVKEPMTKEETPWHQDLPYWPLRGEDIMSFWVPFDHVAPEGGAMRYVKGSHRSGVMYAPRAFGKDSGFAEIYARMGLPEAPSAEILLDGAELLVCAVEPGDIVVHHPLTFHWSPGNLSADHRRRALALRYVGDDAVYDSRPGTFTQSRRVEALLPEAIAYRDGDRIGGANFPHVWPRR
jgi:ectoine hydroxylase-related dioxygenase (phytanoyl-CoA dioxygenase family)